MEIVHKFKYFCIKCPFLRDNRHVHSKRTTFISGERSSVNDFESPRGIMHFYRWKQVSDRAQ